MATRAATLSLLLATASSCAPTEIVVSIATDLSIPTFIDRVGLDVAFEDSRERVVSQVWEVDRNREGAIALPATVGLVPDGDPARLIRVTVLGLKSAPASADATVITREARLAFAKGHILLLRMNLLKSCLYEVCPPEQTCGENGCEPIDKTNLPPYNPDAALGPLPDGGPDRRRDQPVPDRPALDRPATDTRRTDRPATDTKRPPDLKPDTKPAPDLCAWPAAWWNPAYKRRRKLTIDETATGSLPTAYSVVAMIDTAAAVASGQMLATGADLRVVRTVGATHLELDRRLVGMGTAQTQVWFRTQDLVTGSDATYAIYHANPSAASAPSHWADAMGTATPSRVYLAADDFEGNAVGALPAGWEGSPDYRVALDGTNKVLEIKDSTTQADYLFAGSYGWTDVVVEARLRILDVNGEHYGLFTRAPSPTAFTAIWYGLGTSNQALQLYTVSIASATATGLTTSTLRGTWNLGSPAGTTWHSLKLATAGDVHGLYFDGQQIASPTVASTPAQGRVGLCAGYPAAHALWDDLVVRKLVVPEPTVTAGSTEVGCP